MSRCSASWYQPAGGPCGTGGAETTGGRQLAAGSVCRIAGLLADWFCCFSRFVCFLACLAALPVLRAARSLSERKSTSPAVLTLVILRNSPMPEISVFVVFVSGVSAETMPKVLEPRLGIPADQ